MELQESIARLTRDEIAAAKLMTKQEARFLVDAYYQMQDNRIRSDGQVRSMKGEPTSLLRWLSEQNASLENQIKRALGAYAKESPYGKWPLSVCGVGPVITAGLIAHIDMDQCPTSGHIMSFAGLTGAEWKKGEKRPWNAEFKKLVVFKIGESFVKQQNREQDFYGKLFAERKASENARNDAGMYADKAKEILATKRFSKSTEAYKAYSQGKFPPAHIHARARRFAVKIFISHLFEKWYPIYHDGEKAPVPYEVAHLGHVHMIKAPD